MNLQEYLEYRIECPLCQKRLETYFYFSIIKPPLTIIYRLRNEKLLKTPHLTKFNKGLWDVFPKASSIDEIFGVFQRRKADSILFIETTCSTNHYSHRTKTIHPSQYYKYLHSNSLNKLEILLEEINIENYIISNSFQFSPITNIWPSLTSEYIRLPFIPITSWEPTNIQEQIDKYLILQ